MIRLFGLLAAMAVPVLAQQDEWQKSMKLARALDAAGDFRRSAAQLQEAVKAAENSGPLAGTLLPPALNSLGLEYEAMGLSAQAIPIYQRVLAMVEKNKGRENLDYAVALGNMAAAHLRLEEFRRAEAEARAAIDIRMRLTPGDEAGRGVTCSILAQLLVQQGRWDEAAPLIERDVEVFARDNHPSLRFGMALNNLGVLRGHQRRDEESAEALRRSIAESEGVAGTGHPFLLEPINNLATAYANLGRNADSAAAYERAIAIAEEQGLFATPAYAQALANYSELLRRMGKKKEASRRMAQAKRANGESRTVNGIGMTVAASALR